MWNPTSPDQLDVSKIKRLSPYLTNEHAEALINFTSKTFTSEDGKKKVSFDRRHDQETTINPFVVFRTTYLENGEPATAHGVTSLELVLLADSLLKK